MSLNSLNILLLEPYAAGSHVNWANGLIRHSQHSFARLSLPATNWKWRMRAAAVPLARLALSSRREPDVIVASDMLDAALLLSLLQKDWKNCKLLVYFHENQLSYPWSARQRHKNSHQYHLGITNFTSSLVADTVVFNSDFHRNSYLEELHLFLQSCPDFKELDSVKLIEAKSNVLPPGIEMDEIERSIQGVQRSLTEQAVVVWNHRWDYDKRPDLFFSALETLSEEGLEFQLIVLGEQMDVENEHFMKAKATLAKHIIHWGFVESRDDYYRWLARAHLIPLTSDHDFFGLSVVEGLCCGCIPLLPHRLSYPEHLAPQHREAFLYENQKEFTKKLGEMICGFRELPYGEFREQIRDYDWKKVIGQYDDILKKTAVRE